MDNYREPRWNNEAKTEITIKKILSEDENSRIMEDEIHSSGDVYVAALAEEFGPIVDFLPPAPAIDLKLEELKNSLRALGKTEEQIAAILALLPLV